MTGDLVNREDRELEPGAVPGPDGGGDRPGLFAPGNHEGDNPCWPELRDRLEEAGVQVLEDRAVLWGLRGRGST
ncbi:MAG: hypothetical protein ACLUJG_18255 [Lawsonibacter sp.]